MVFRTFRSPFLLLSLAGYKIRGVFEIQLACWWLDVLKMHVPALTRQPERHQAELADNRDAMIEDRDTMIRA
jgi:hypothetical protein